MVTPYFDSTYDTNGGFASAGAFEQIFGLEGKLDQRVETCEGGEVEDGIRLLLSQNQGRGMRFLQTLEPMLEHQPLTEIQRRLDIRQTCGFEKEFLTSAREKFPLREDSRPGAIV
jgi:hypothetical protein